ncbi:hypothetical protein QJQ45_000032 [Haematococcus lacustris]|nr:hypothetical protein QJQ45_000032 [Haematococcus lacustris]
MRPEFSTPPPAPAQVHISPSSPLASRSFYDRDVSATLNIRRCAFGPGPRPTELCYWAGRPAMPKPARPGVGAKEAQEAKEATDGKLQELGYANRKLAAQLEAVQSTAKATSERDKRALHNLREGLAAVESEVCERAALGQQLVAAGSQQLSTLRALLLLPPGRDVLGPSLASQVAQSLASAARSLTQMTGLLSGTSPDQQGQPPRPAGPTAATRAGQGGGNVEGGSGGGGGLGQPGGQRGGGGPAVGPDSVAGGAREAQLVQQQQSLREEVLELRCQLDQAARGAAATSSQLQVCWLVRLPSPRHTQLLKQCLVAALTAQEQVASSQQEAVELRAQAARLRADLQEGLAREAELRCKLDDLATRAAAAERAGEQGAVMAAQLVSAQQQLATKDQQLQEQRVELHASIDRLKQQNSQLQSELQCCHDQLAQQALALASLRNDLSDQQQDVTAALQLMAHNHSLQAQRAAATTSTHTKPGVAAGRPDPPASCGAAAAARAGQAEGGLGGGAGGMPQSRGMGPPPPPAWPQLPAAAAAAGGPMPAVSREAAGPQGAGARGATWSPVATSAAQAPPGLPSAAGRAGAPPALRALLPHSPAPRPPYSPAASRLSRDWIHSPQQRLQPHSHWPEQRQQHQAQPHNTQQQPHIAQQQQRQQQQDQQGLPGTWSGSGSGSRFRAGHGATAEVWGPSEQHLVPPRPHHPPASPGSRPWALALAQPLCVPTSTQDLDPAPKPSTRPATAHAAAGSHQQPAVRGGGEQGWVLGGQLQPGAGPAQGWAMQRPHTAHHFSSQGGGQVGWDGEGRRGGWGGPGPSAAECPPGTARSSTTSTSSGLKPQHWPHFSQQACQPHEQRSQDAWQRGPNGCVADFQDDVRRSTSDQGWRGSAYNQAGKPETRSPLHRSAAHGWSDGRQPARAGAGRGAAAHDMHGIDAELDALEAALAAAASASGLRPTSSS